MKIYELNADPDRFDPLTRYNAEDFTLDDHFDGTSRIATWKTLHMRYFSEIEPPVLPKGDYPGFIGIPMFPAKTVDILGDLLEGKGELLPVDVHGEPFYMFNCLNIVDCLDHKRSDLERFSNGSVMRAEIHVFYEEKIGESTIFKLPEFPKGPEYVTQEFVDRVHKAGLKGFSFFKVYDSDT